MAREKVTHKVLAIDPGLSSGWTYWRRTGNDNPVLLAHGLVRAERGLKNYYEKTVGIVEELTSLYRLYYGQVVLELPQVFHSAGGESVAMAGHIHKLTFLVGALYQSFMNVSYGSVRLMTPSMWKGQLSKAMVEKRVRRYTGEVELIEDEWDAAGIALANWNLL